MLYNNISDGEQGILTLLLGGNEVEVNLTPEASNYIQQSGNLTLVLSDLCAYLADEGCYRTYGLVNINNNANLFASNATILQNNQFVFITCSDQSLILTEIHNAFSLTVKPIPSDTVAVTYNNISPAFVSDSTQTLGGSFSIQYAQQDWQVISPDPINCQPKITDDKFIDKNLLCVNLDHAPITEIGQIGCVPLCVNTSSDPDYICQLLDCCESMNEFLSDCYPGYLDKISDICTIRYNGPVCGLEGKLNLSQCRLRVEGVGFFCGSRFIPL